MASAHDGFPRVPGQSGSAHPFSSIYGWLQNTAEAPTVIQAETLPAPEFRCEGRAFVSFSSNNYLSLASDPRMIAAARSGLERYGVGNCESRLLGGDLRIYRELEAKIAHLKRKDDSVLFATGYLTNLGALSAFARASRVLRLYGYREPQPSQVTYFSDELNHLSIREGIRASGAARATYPHCDLDRLEELLKRHDSPVKMIVTDGVFSQDGDIAPLPGLIELAERYDAHVYVDDAHGTGVLGRDGGGVAEHFDLHHPRMIHMGTLSKAYGAIGGFVAAGREITEVLRVASSAYGFTSTLPPDQAYAVCAAMDIVVGEPERRTRLWSNQRYFCAALRAAGFTPHSEQTPIVPVLIGSETLAQRYSDELHAWGYHVDTAKFPAVAIGKARLRFILNAGHTRDQIDGVVAALVSAREKLTFVPRSARSPFATRAVKMELA